MYHFLFEHSPVSLWIEDLSAVKIRVEELRQKGVQNFEEYFRRNPEETTECVRLARVIDVNQATLALFGTSSKEELVAHLDSLQAPNASPLIRFTPNLLCLVLNETRCAGEFAARTAQGRSLYLNYIWNAYGAATAPYSLIIYSIFDITARKFAEEERARLAEQLRHVQKVEAIGVLAGGLAHDFNNILTSIMGNVEILKARLPLNSEQAELVREIGSVASSSTGLIRQILSLGRRDAMSKTTVDVHRLVRNVRNLLTHSCGLNIRIALALDTRDCSVLASPDQFEAALLNLALNARDAMPSGGIMTFSTTRLTVPQSPQEEIPPGRYICISVSDTGTGMNQETRRRIFEPFFTTKPNGAGTGLGLASVCDFVKSCKGTIRVDTKEGKGSTFTLILPEAVEVNAIPQVRPLNVHE